MKSTASVIQTATAKADRSFVFECRGWQVDASLLRGLRAPEAVITAVQHQLDIVAGVGLKADVLRLMRSVRLWANPFRRDGGPARYCRATGVNFRVLRLDPRRPILLHEFLHGWHDQYLGFDDAQIIGFHTASVASGRWPPEAYMLTNHKEFFAVTASAYLWEIPRPPFSRDQLLKTEPEYCRWLANQLEEVRPA